MAERILDPGCLRGQPGPGSRASSRAATCSSRATASSQVGKGLSAEGAQVIDATGDIVIPGFIDTHRHTWETSIRTCAPDYALITYFSGILDQFAPKYRPDDVLAANRWGALECINAGITTLVDWSHIMNTPDHADAAIKGLQGQRHPVGVRVRVPQHVARRPGGSGPTTRGSVETIDGDLARRLREPAR